MKLSGTTVTKPVKRRLRSAQRRALQPVLRRQSAILQTNQLQLIFGYRSLAATGGPMPSYRDVGFRVFCDADEDGILLFLLSVVGSGNRRLVDLGSASMEASNTSNLILHHGWTGLLVDADDDAVEIGKADYRTLGVTPPPMISTWLTAENVNEIIRDSGATGDIDLLSIDIDGNDYWLWRAIDVIEPRIVVIEYQDIIGPERSLTIPYDPHFFVGRYPVNAQYNNYAGASLRAMVSLGATKGYRLVATNSYGFNAFFLREDLSSKLIPEIAVEEGFPHPWNEYGRRQRWPLVADMPWEEV